MALPIWLVVIPAQAGMTGLRSDFFYLDEVESDRGFAAEDGDEDGDLSAVLVHLLHAAQHIGEGAFGNPHHVALSEADDGAGFARGYPIQDVVNFPVIQGHGARTVAAFFLGGDETR